MALLRYAKRGATEGLPNVVNVQPWTFYGFALGTGLRNPTIAQRVGRSLALISSVYAAP